MCKNDTKQERICGIEKKYYPNRTKWSDNHYFCRPLGLIVQWIE